MFKTPNEEKTGFLEKAFYAGVPAITIIFAEFLIFGGRLKEATIAYILLLLAFQNRQHLRKNRMYVKFTKLLSFFRSFA